MGQDSLVSQILLFFFPGMFQVAGVPGVTEGLFNLRLEALAAEKKKADGERLLYRCSLCDKEYSTVKAHAQHLQSKLHVSRASSLPSPADAGNF